jgi:hypothetical protein
MYRSAAPRFPHFLMSPEAFSYFPMHAKWQKNMRAEPPGLELRWHH